MRNTYHAIAGILALLLVTLFVVGSFQASITSAPESKAVTSGVSLVNSSSKLPSIGDDMPDLKLIPIYPNATITFTSTQSTQPSHVTYEVAVSPDQITQYYEEMLSQNGWKAKSISASRKQYIWTDPNGVSAFHLYLIYVVSPSLDQIKSVVELDFGRIPSIEALPVFSNSKQDSSYSSTVEKTFPSGKTRVRVIDTSYTTTGDPKEIAAFYIDTLKANGWNYQSPGWSTTSYAWFPFDNVGSWLGLNANEGLYFIHWYPAGETDRRTITTTHLLISAIPQNDGSILITLHVEEWEDIINF